MCQSMLSLSKIAHPMLCDHPFCQRNRATKRVGVGVGGDREVRGGWPKFEKGRVGNIGGLHKIQGT